MAATTTNKKTMTYQAIAESLLPPSPAWFGDRAVKAAKLFFMPLVLTYRFCRESLCFSTTKPWSMTFDAPVRRRFSSSDTRKIIILSLSFSDESKTELKVLRSIGPDQPAFERWVGYYAVLKNSDEVEHRKVAFERFLIEVAQIVKRQKREIEICNAIADREDEL